MMGSNQPLSELPVRDRRQTQFGTSKVKAGSVVLT